MLHKENSKLSLLASSLLMLAVFAALIITPQSGTAQEISGRKVKNLERAFEKAAAEFGVPSELLKAIAYAETRFDNHNGEPSQDNGYGVMHLADNNENQSLNEAAAILGVPADVLKQDDRQNIRGGAAILHALAEKEGLTADEFASLAAWYPVAARYSNASNESLARFYGDEIYRLLQSGFSAAPPDGAEIIVVAIEVEPARGRYEAIPSIEDEPTIESTDYGPALWVPANSGNYTVSNRPSSGAISYVVIHTTQGSYAGTISWFQNPSSNVSAHYVIRSSDGQITQMVREKDIAYHARSYNSTSIGIEHEGFVNNPSWYTDAMYRASAALTRNICNKYGIPKTRSRILGHSEVPGNDHTDPGPNWNWTYYMQLVTQSGSGWETIVDNATSGGFTASGNWGLSSYSSQRYGANYRYANPQPVSDAAWFSANIPSAGNYEVYVWHPANSGYNSSTPFVISTTGGTAVARVNQQINGGRWVSIGTHSLSAGDHNIVGVSRWSSESGYVIADAVKIVRR